MRTRSALKNVLLSLAYEIVLVLFGLVVPRLIIGAYGSEVNGLTSTVTQVLQILNLLQAGAVGASIFQMYKPVAEHDYLQVSRVLRASRRYFVKIGSIFLLLVFLLAPIMGFGIKSGLPLWEKTLAFVILGLNGAFYFFFTSWFDILFSSHQKRFVMSVAGILEKLLYYALVFTIVFVKLHFVWLYIATLLGTCVKVIFLYVCYRKKFKPLLTDVSSDHDFRIVNRGYLLCNQIATQTIDAMPTIMVTALSSLSSASIYAIYHLVQNMIRMVVRTLQLSVSEIFGNLVASEKEEKVAQVYNLMEFVFFLTAGILCVCEMFLFMPFINLYTSGNTLDVNYLFPLLALFIVLYDVFYALFMPCYTLTNVLGLFKETYLQSVVCAIIATIISCAFGFIHWTFILLGPIFYYITSLFYRLLIVRRKTAWVNHLRFVRRLLVVLVMIAVYAWASFLIYQNGYATNWCLWIVQAALCGLSAVAVIGGYAILFEREETKAIFGYAKKLIKKKVNKKGYSNEI